MLRIYANVLRRSTSQMFISTRFTATDPTSGSINAAHDKFAEREQALENAYFRKLSDELLVQLRERHVIWKNNRIILKENRNVLKNKLKN